MDLQMPGMDGLEATRRIRAFEQAQRRKPVPMIALSASVLEQDWRNARAAGMDGFASKPLEPARLFREIARVLSLHATGDAMDWGTLVTHTRPSGLGSPAPQAGLPPAIDWERGLQLWGQMPLLRDAPGAPAARTTKARPRPCRPWPPSATWMRPRAGPPPAWCAQPGTGAAANPDPAHRLRPGTHGTARGGTSCPPRWQQHHALAQDASRSRSPAEGSHAPLSDAQRSQARSAAQALQQALVKMPNWPSRRWTFWPSCCLPRPWSLCRTRLTPLTLTRPLQQLQQLRTHWIDEPTENPHDPGPRPAPRLPLVDDEPTNLQVLRHPAGRLPPAVCHRRRTRAASGARAAAPPDPARHR